MTSQETIFDGEDTSNISVAELDSIVKVLAEKRIEKEEIEATLKAKNIEIQDIERRTLNILKSLDRQSYPTPFGTVSVNDEFSCRLPKEESKDLLWEYMREKGIYDKYATVHATAFKSLYKATWEAAVANGADPITFAMPGCEPPTLTTILKFRKK